MENNNLNVLDELNKGATMGMDAIEFVVKKVGDEDFRKTLELEYNKYKDISRRANNLYENYTYEKEPHETSAMNKVMTWWGVQMKAMSDKSNSNLSELLLNGTNMGIIEGRRLAFDGKAIQLFANWIKWFFLIIITIGIYGFWVSIKMKKWVTKHTYFAVEK